MQRTRYKIMISVYNEVMMRNASFTSQYTDTKDSKFVEFSSHKT